MQNDAERQFPNNPQPRRRRAGLALALASACVFSVAVISHTHPPFPAPDVRLRDEATDGGLGAPTPTPSPQDPFSVYGAKMLKELNDDAWWRFICRLVVRNGTRTSSATSARAMRRSTPIGWNARTVAASCT